MKSKILPIFQHCRRQFYTCQLVNPNKSKMEVPAHDGIHQQILEHADSFNKEKSAKEIATNNDITEGQLRDWARKYKIHGDNALDDKRGIRKDQSDLSQEEILKRKNKELEEKNRRLEAELLLIKKLKELEGGVI